MLMGGEGLRWSEEVSSYVIRSEQEHPTPMLRALVLPHGSCSCQGTFPHDFSLESISSLVALLSFIFQLLSFKVQLQRKLMYGHAGLKDQQLGVLVSVHSALHFRRRQGTVFLPYLIEEPVSKLLTTDTVQLISSQ